MSKDPLGSPGLGGWLIGTKMKQHLDDHGVIVTGTFAHYARWTQSSSFDDCTRFVFTVNGKRYFAEAQGLYDRNATVQVLCCPWYPRIFRRVL